MSVITFFGRAYTGKAQLAQKAADVLGCNVLLDDQVFKKRRLVNVMV